MIGRDDDGVDDDDDDHDDHDNDDDHDDDDDGVEEPVDDEEDEHEDGVAGDDDDEEPDNIDLDDVINYAENAQSKVRGRGRAAAAVRKELAEIADTAWAAKVAGLVREDEARDEELAAARAEVVALQAEAARTAKVAAEKRARAESDRIEASERAERKRLEAAEADRRRRGERQRRPAAVTPPDPRPRMEREAAPRRPAVPGNHAVAVPNAATSSPARSAPSATGPSSKAAVDRQRPLIQPQVAPRRTASQADRPRASALAASARPPTKPIERVPVHREIPRRSSPAVPTPPAHTGATAVPVTAPPVRVPLPESAPGPAANATAIERETPTLTGADLSEWRRRYGLTQQASAQRLGVGQGTVSKAEAAPSTPLGPTLARGLAEAIAAEG